jgi:hypothetical protein
MNTKKKTLTVCMLGALYALPSHSLELVNVPQHQDRPAPVAETPSISEIQPTLATPAVATSAPPQHVQPPRSFGSDIPIALAARMIAPEGWILQIPDSLQKSDHRVSWSGSTNWREALEQVLSSAKPAHHASFDDNAREVIISSMRKLQPDGQSTWFASSGHTLRQIMTEWASSDGWDLHWDMDTDFVIGGQASFRNNLAGALNELVMAVPEASRLVMVEMYAGNRVVRVTTRRGASL